MDSESLTEVWKYHCSVYSVLVLRVVVFLGDLIGGPHQICC